MSSFPSACVIGWPIAHSRSPLIHGYWLKQHGLQGLYAREGVAPEHFTHFISHMHERGYIGANVTIPHKEAAYHLVQVKDDIALRLKAVNTLWFEQGNLHGTNSDGIGFTRSLDHQLPGWDQNIAHVLILGAGGATRAIVDALITRGAGRIYIYNRTIENALALQDQFFDHVSICTSEVELQHAYQAAGLVVNTTSLGLDGTSCPPVYFQLCAPKTNVTDIVYTPLETPFLKAAKLHGLRTAHGLDMLFYQATVGFEKWFGVLPEVTEELRQLVLNEIRAGT